MRRGLAAVLLSTALLAGYSRLEAPWHLLGGVCLVPFLAALANARGLRAALLLAAVQAAGLTLAALHWFPAAMQRYAGLPLAAGFALLLLSAPLLQPQFLALAGARHALRRAGPGLAALGGALAYVGAEWVLPRLFDVTLGYGLHPSPTLRQAADVGGVRGLTLALLLANEAVLALGGAWAGRGRPGAARGAGARSRQASAAAGPRPAWPQPAWPQLASTRALVLALPLALAFSYGAWRLRSLSAQEPSTRAPLRVGLVQANLTHYAALAQEQGSYGAVRTVLDAHYALSEALLAQPTELLVWPETVYPTTFGTPRSEAGAELDAELRAFPARAGAALLFGAYASDGGREFNAAVLLGRGAAAQTYLKARPFPLTEYVPPLLDGPRVRAALPWLGTWSPGPGAQLLTLAREGGGPALRLLPLICFDVAAPGLVAEAARAGADAIVTLANDAWFSGGEGARQHLVVAAFRSVETRLPQVRATPSGISAEIDALGDIVHHTQEDRAEVLHASVAPGARAQTLAVRAGDWVGAAGLPGVALLLLLGLRARRARPSRPGDPRA